MSLIRSQQAELFGQVRPAPIQRLRPAVGMKDSVGIDSPLVDPEVALLRAEVERLTQIVDAQASELEAQPAKEQSAFDRGQKEGFASGEMAAQDLQEERLGLLAQSVEGALGRLEQDWAGLERLAGELSVACLDRILGDPGQYAALSAKILRNQLAALAAQRVLRIEVSKIDFPDDQALTALTTSPDVGVVALDNLPPGACHIRLSLGAVEVGIDQQWSALRPLLAQWAEGEVP